MVNYAQKGNKGYPLLSQCWGGNFASSLVPSMAVQVVPVDKSYGYESLTHGSQLNGNNYFNVSTAYPSYQNNCTRFVNRKCDGMLSNEKPAETPVSDTLVRSNYNLSTNGMVPVNSFLVENKF